MTKSLLSKVKIVEITWLDAQSTMDSWNLEEIRAEHPESKPVVTKSVGYLLYENKEYIVLGFMVFGEFLVKHSQTIPKGMIKKRRVLK